MSDIKTILPEGYGMPLAWLYTPSGDVLRDFDNTPITKYVESFEYEYAEEEDDTCDIKLKLPNVNSLDLPYFQQDVVLHVQWGFMLNNGKVIKSPVRKVAIRDLTTAYTTGGIDLTLECTDLVSYMKGFRSKTVRSDSRALKVSRAVDKSEDNFMDWLKEVNDGRYTATYTKGKDVVRLDLNGRMQNAQQDPRTGTYKIAIDNARVQKDFMPNLKVGKIIKGKSKTITQAIEDQLKLQADIENGGGGKPIMDTTDNNIHIKHRNFDQPIFKTYIWAKGNGEVIKFDSNTSTRATKEDSATSTGVDPFRKEVKTTTVETADTSKNDYKKIQEADFSKLDFSNGNNARTALLDKPYKPTDETLNSWLEDARNVFKYNIENPLNQKELPDLRYVINKEFVNDPVMGTKTSPIFVKVPSRQILNSPDFIALNSQVSKDIRAQYRKAASIGGTIIDKIQRKYEGTIEVIGDPSLIKGKIINITGLSRLDNGKWYITRCRHTIKMAEGYMVSMDVMKKPKTVTLSSKSMATNPKYDPDSDTVYWPVTTNEDIYKMFEEKKEEIQNSEKLNDVEINSEYKTEEDNVREIEQRLEYLNAEEDYVLHKDISFEPTKRTDNITNTDIN